MTEAEMRREVLKEFAKLTPHKPSALDNMFHLSVAWPENPIPGDSLRFEASFGKRSASQPVHSDAMSWSPDRFNQEVARPLARSLLESA